MDLLRGSPQAVAPGRNLTLTLLRRASSPASRLPRCALPDSSKKYALGADSLCLPPAPGDSITAKSMDAIDGCW